MTGWLWRLADGARHRVRRRSWPADRAAGARGEDLAHRYLERQGYIVVARNWRGAGGEIDLIAWEGDRIAFVEVKSRTTDATSAPERNIDESKQQALVRAAREYTRRAGIEWERVRFDVVSAVLSDPPRLALYRDALQASRTL